MKRINCFISLLALIFSLFIMYHVVYGSVFKWIRVGRYQTKVVDSGDQGESSGEGTFSYYYFDDFTRSKIDNTGWQLGCKNWADEGGTTFPVKNSGAGVHTADENIITMPVPDDEGLYIRRYRKYQSPTITVDGLRMDEPFPLDESDEVKPDAILGTADIMIESQIKTSMGLSIHQKVLGWSQMNHDDYIIFDWTFTNTGDIDLDADIELPNQTLNDVYFLRVNTNFAGTGSCSRTWNSYYGEYPSDTLRLAYTYSMRQRDAIFDDFGDPRSNGYLRKPWYVGEAMIHVDTSPTDKTDDPSQPQMTGVMTSNQYWVAKDENMTSESDKILLYEAMQFSFLPFLGVSYMEGTYPGTHHCLRMDEMGAKFTWDLPYYAHRASNHTASGPFTLAHGQSFRIVWATVLGSISPEVAWEKGRAWFNGTLEPPPGCVFGVADNLPPQYKVYPSLYAADDRSTEYNNWAKDCWVCTSKDSIFQNAWAAQWNIQKNYDIPIPPPAPSIEVKSLPDMVKISWGNESESASDFAGYRVYRAVGNPGPTIIGDKMIGSWYPIFECGKGTANALTNSYEDKDAERGQAYYYYVAAFDDGIENIPGVKGKRESLESGLYLNYTPHAAYLTRAPGTLSTVRIVPNPFNIGAAELQYIGEPNKIMFIDLPPVCTIKIYTESGDFVNTLEHTDGSGDEAWGALTEEHLTSESGQIVVSGIYIAVIETPEGESTALKFVVVR